jgi:spermidine/putrescine transport system ATP-binding protein
MTARIDVENLTRHYGSACALAGVSLAVGAGEYCVLLGPSGCGKTTLLNILGGFADPSSGSLRIGGRDMLGVPAARRPTTTVFQDYALFPHMTLLDNVGFGLRMRGQGRAERARRAEQMLALVGLTGAGAKRPAQLSGGQRQRVALARALAVEPDVLLLDEPLGALDLNLRRTMQEELKAIQRRVGATFVHVTHDQDEAMAIADRIVVMNKGLIEDEGPPERVYRRPKTRFAAAFLGEMNFVPAEVRNGRLTSPLGDLGPAGQAAGPVTLGIRPAHVRPGPGAQIPARIVEVMFQGIHRRVRVEAAGLTLLAHLPLGQGAAAGDPVMLAVDTPEIVLLP